MLEGIIGMFGELSRQKTRRPAAGEVQQGVEMVLHLMESAVVKPIVQFFFCLFFGVAVAFLNASL